MPKDTEKDQQFNKNEFEQSQVTPEQEASVESIAEETVENIHDKANNAKKEFPEKTSDINKLETTSASAVKDIFDASGDIEERKQIVDIHGNVLSSEKISTKNETKEQEISEAINSVNSVDELVELFKERLGSQTAENLEKQISKIRSGEDQLADMSNIAGVRDKIGQLLGINEISPDNEQLSKQEQKISETVDNVSTEEDKESREIDESLISLSKEELEVKIEELKVLEAELYASQDNNFEGGRNGRSAVLKRASELLKDTKYAEAKFKHSKDDKDYEVLQAIEDALKAVELRTKEAKAEIQNKEIRENISKLKNLIDQ